jgi:hypothetical protein
MDNFRDNQEQSIQETMDNLFDGYLSEINTGVPCYVVNIDLNKYTVDVQPVFKSLYQDVDNEIEQDHPIINDVPIMIYRGGGFMVKPPIKKGDIGYLHFCQRSIDDYQDTDGKAQLLAGENRKHDINDALFFPAITTNKNKPSYTNNDGLVIGKEDGNSITKWTNDIEITTNEYKVSASQVKIGSHSASIPVAKADKTNDNFNSVNAWVQVVATALQALGIPTPTVNINDVSSSKVKIDS